MYAFNDDKSKAEIETGGTVLFSGSSYFSNRTGSAGAYVYNEIPITLSERMGNYEKISIMTLLGDEGYPIEPGFKCGSFNFATAEVAAINSLMSEPKSLSLEDASVKTQIGISINTTNLVVRAYLDAGEGKFMYIVVLGFDKKS